MKPVKSRSRDRADCLEPQALQVPEGRQRIAQPFTGCRFNWTARCNCIWCFALPRPQAPKLPGEESPRHLRRPRRRSCCDISPPVRSVKKKSVDRRGGFVVVQVGEVRLFFWTARLRRAVQCVRPTPRATELPGLKEQSLLTWAQCERMFGSHD